MSSRYMEDVEAALQFLTMWDGALLGITVAYFAVRSWTNYFTLSSALRRLRAAPNLRVFDLGSLPNVEEDDTDGPLVVVRGIVQPKSVFDRLRMAFPLSSNERAMIAQRTHTITLPEEKIILPVGKEITVVGICTRRGDAVEIKSCRDLPIFLSDMTKDEIEADMTSKSDIHFWYGILFGTISGAILGYAIHRMWLRWQEQRERRQAEELQRDNGDDETGNVADGEQCVVCLMRRNGVASVPFVFYVYREGGFSDVPFLLAKNDDNHQN